MARKGYAAYWGIFIGTITGSLGMLIGAVVLRTTIGTSAAAQRRELAATVAYKQWTSAVAKTARPVQRKSR